MSTVLLALALGLPATPSGDGDWPWFLGPERNGKAHVPGVSFDWPEGGPAVSWKVAIGSGYGGVAARDGEVFLLDREVGSMDMLRVFDLESGEENWATEYEAPGRLNFPGSRTVPTVLEDYVYTCGGFGHVTCFDRKSHEIVWNINVEELYDGEMPLFGWSNSPLVVDDLVIVAAMGEFVGLVALDRFTGDEVWITDSVGYSHSTPTLVDLHGEPQVLFMSTRAQGSGQDQAAAMMVSSFAPGDGSLLWRHSTTLTRLPIPGPVQLDDERLFLTGGYRGGSTLLHVAKDGGDYAFDEVFHIDRGAQIHVPILHEDHLYTLVNENWNNNTRQMRQEGESANVISSGDREMSRFVYRESVNVLEWRKKNLKGKS